METLSLGRSSFPMSMTYPRKLLAAAFFAVVFAGAGLTLNGAI